MGEDTPRNDKNRVAKQSELELRVARLESLLRLLHPEVLDEEDRPPDPEDSRAERKRKMRLILGGAEGATGVAALAVLLARKVLRTRRVALVLTAATVSCCLAAVIALHGHGPVHHYAARPPRPAPSTATIPQRPRQVRRVRKPRKPQPNPAPSQPVGVVSSPSPTGQPAPSTSPPPNHGSSPPAHSPPPTTPPPVPTTPPPTTAPPPGQPVCIELPPIVGICLGEARGADLHDVPYQFTRPQELEPAGLARQRAGERVHAGSAH